MCKSNREAICDHALVCLVDCGKRRDEKLKRERRRSSQLCFFTLSFNASLTKRAEI